MHIPTTRCYTVGYICDAKYQPVPAVTLKGHWLKEMGFGYRDGAGGQGNGRLHDTDG